MERYSEYKDSGVQWLGEIPSHWDMKKIRYILSLNNEKTTSNGGQLLSLSQYTGVSIKGNDSTGIKASEDTTGYNVVKAGQFVMNIMLAWNGSYAVSKYDGIISPAYCVFDFIQDCSKGYYNYLLRLNVYSGAFKTESKGIIDSRLRLYPQYFKNFPLIVPPLPEQQAIATYLDDFTSKIDKAIEQQKRMIDLLQERKQIIISNAVTKGLNPNVKMKDSGLEWIGMVPSHWIICRVKDILLNGSKGIKIGPFGSSLTGKVGMNLPYKVYGQWNIVSGDFSIGSNTVSADTYKILKESYSVISGDILISMMGTIGKCAIIPNDIQEGIMDSHVVKARLNNTYICSFFFEYFYDKDKSNVIYNQLQKVKGGSIMDGLNSTIIKSLNICIPPLSEQQSIVEHLDKRCAEIDKAIEQQKRMIDLLQERKKIIISDVVTGKIKVS